TSCVSKTACSPSGGTSSRTRRRESLRRAGGPCSGTSRLTAAAKQAKARASTAGIRESLAPPAAAQKSDAPCAAVSCKRCGSWTLPISRRNGKTQHLRIPVNAKPLRRFPAAQPLIHHRLTLAQSSTVNILPAPPCQSSTSERPSRTLLRCCHNAAHSRSSRTFCLRDLYSCDGDLSG